MIGRRFLIKKKKYEKPVIFEYGSDSLLRGEICRKNSDKTDGTRFENGILIIGRDKDGRTGKYEPGYADIRFDNSGNYKKLFFECCTNVRDYGENYEYFYLGFGEKRGGYHLNYEEYKYVPANYEKVEFDISKMKWKEFFIKSTSYTRGSAELKIKNIWLE